MKENGMKYVEYTVVIIVVCNTSWMRHKYVRYLNIDARRRLDC